MPTHRRFHALKGAMWQNDINQAILAEKLGRCETYVSVRMNGKTEWDLADMYTICDLLDIPYEKLSEYFPPPPKNLARQRENA